MLKDVVDDVFYRLLFQIGANFLHVFFTGAKRLSYVPHLGKHHFFVLSMILASFFAELRIVDIGQYHVQGLLHITLGLSQSKRNLYLVKPHA